MIKLTAENSGELRLKLYRAIKQHSGIEDEALLEIRSAADGFSKFIYTKDILEFYDKHEDAVYELLQETASDMGYDSVDALVATFGRKDMLTTSKGRKQLLVWFTLEEIGRTMQALNEK